jgi:hypothetical protein
MSHKIIDKLDNNVTATEEELFEADEYALYLTFKEANKSLFKFTH